MSSAAKSRQPLVITSGEPAGIGPDLCLQIAQEALDEAPVVMANKALLKRRAELLGLEIKLRDYVLGEPAQAHTPGELIVYDLALSAPVETGQLNKANAGYVLKMLETAVDRCQGLDFRGMVTAPVHKGIINEAGVIFSGHTELLAERTHTPLVVMMLATEGLRVALATTHLPLRDIADAITPDLLSKVLHILQDDLIHKFGIAKPRILVCGLNPHAGEGGHLGREEIEIIEPCLDDLRAQGMNLIGPLPADTLFTEHHLKTADAVLAMYHDQGLPVLKYKGFGNAVNITLGLPIIRTSVDHGTALDLAGTGRANAGSLLCALRYANDMGQAHA